MDALWDGGPLGADRLKPQHTPPLQEPGDKCHFIPSVFVVTARLCDPFLCLCGHCAFSFLNFTPAKLCAAAFHTVAALLRLQNLTDISHTWQKHSKPLPWSGFILLWPIFGTLHFDLYNIHVKFPDCILHGRLWLTDTCQQTDTQKRCK